MKAMNVGFAVFAVAVLVWASIDYNRFIKFWMLQPAPYTKPVTIGFRLFFLACVVGGAWHVIDVAADARLTGTLCLSALAIALAWFSVFFLMVHVVEWMGRKRLSRKSGRPLP